MMSGKELKTDDRIALALKAFNNNYNCAQSIVSAYPDLTEPCTSLAMMQAAGFGGGMGRLQGTCGAVTGSVMVIGLNIGTEVPDDLIKSEIAALVKEFNDRFVQLNKSTACRELIGVDLNTAEGREASRQPGIKDKICSKCIVDAILILEEILF